MTNKRKYNRKEDNNVVIDHSEMVKSEIDSFYAFKTAQGQLVNKYENLIEKLYEYAPVIILIADISNEDVPHVYINKYAELELGYRVQEMITGGKKFINQSYHPAEVDDTITKYAEFLDALHNSDPESGEKMVLELVKRIRHSEGHYIWFNIRTTLLSRKVDGSPHLILTIMSNVNDSIELQEEKQKTMSLEISMLKQKIKLQNEQLQTQLLSSIEINKCFDDIIKFSQSVASNSDDTVRPTLSQVIGYIKRNKPSSNVWEEFIARFHDINPNFINYLSKKFPTLTPTELKICSLTKTGLNSKDIASTLKISIRSVENHKYNIRKKFDLEPYQNLYNFISQI
ncbi:MAG: LuxR C-terminal-related transcriptional regulator [Candidatus Kapaibacterium sp.]|jgi:DNA-binding CsgD family transcriptional regulator/PAS domain-containing protein|nr:LuxR C-terminal-related transcriptional regulator [Candidatus Kapabacteria bacterium]